MSSSTVFQTAEDRSSGESCLYWRRNEVTWARLCDDNVHWTRTDVSDTDDTSGLEGAANDPDNHQHQLIGVTDAALCRLKRFNYPRQNLKFEDPIDKNENNYSKMSQSTSPSTPSKTNGYSLRELGHPYTQPDFNKNTQYRRSFNRLLSFGLGTSLSWRHFVMDSLLFIDFDYTAVYRAFYSNIFYTFDIAGCFFLFFRFCCVFTECLYSALILRASDTYIKDYLLIIYLLIIIIIINICS